MDTGADEMNRKERPARVRLACRRRRETRDCDSVPERKRDPSKAKRAVSRRQPETRKRADSRRDPKRPSVPKLRESRIQERAVSQKGSEYIQACRCNRRATSSCRCRSRTGDVTLSVPHRNVLSGLARVTVTPCRTS
jgi:hypothetical protein